ncbi:MAG: sugar kinase [Gammaproteobacteria bacterium]|jgi:pantoate kinase|nr:sugar kinase [Gammaproteobacteria bacterium]
MSTAKAFAPGNVSGVFKIIPDDDPTRMHSLGMGFTVTDGVTVTVSVSDATSVEFNGTPIEFATVRSVVAKLGSVALRVEIETDLPLSGGFGLSGASSLATAYAGDELLGLGLSENALGMIAHVSEVENLTGLGDVAGQFNGGCLVKLVRGDPLAAVTLPVPEQEVYYRYFSPINTKDIIGHPEQRERINAAADTALRKLTVLKDRNESEFAEYISIAKEFSIQSRLLSDDDVKSAIRECEQAGGSASMIMLGNAVFSNVPFRSAKTTRLSKRRVERLR